MFISFVIGCLIGVWVIMFKYQNIQIMSVIVLLFDLIQLTCNPNVNKYHVLFNLILYGLIFFFCEKFIKEASEQEDFDSFFSNQKAFFDLNKALTKLELIEAIPNYKKLEFSNDRYYQFILPILARDIYLRNIQNYITKSKYSYKITFEIPTIYFKDNNLFISKEKQVSKFEGNKQNKLSFGIDFSKGI